MYMAREWPEMIIKLPNAKVVTFIYEQTTYTKIYLDGRVLRLIIKPRPSFGYFSTVICISKI